MEKKTPKGDSTTRKGDKIPKKGGKRVKTPRTGRKQDKTPRRGDGTSEKEDKSGIGKGDKTPRKEQLLWGNIMMGLQANRKHLGTVMGLPRGALIVWKIHQPLSG